MDEESVTGEGDSEFVQSLARGLEILQAFDQNHPRLTLSEAAVRTGFTRASARRFLLTLVRLGHVGSDGKYFWLRPRVLDLGYRYLASQPWWRASQPIMEEAAAAVNETCAVGVLDGTDVVYLAGIAPARIASIDLHPGLRVPAFAASSGRVMLAGLPDAQVDAMLDASVLRPLTDRTVTDRAKLWAILRRVRLQGYCLVDREVDSDIRSLAVAIADRLGRPVAAMNMTCLTGRMKATEMVGKCLPVLNAAARRIGAELPR